MIDIQDTETYGWHHALKGMRNPLNSWNLSDSEYTFYDCYRVGSKDLSLASKLAKAGNDHGKFLRMIHIQTTIIAPLYWWKEFDTYKIGTTANSTSTMHTIHKEEFHLGHFSYNHLNEASIRLLKQTIQHLNEYRKDFIKTRHKESWWQLIQLLPSSFNQLRTVDLSYAVVKNMYKQRKNHKLDEWKWFCEWVEELPYSKELITHTK